jgi:hypothetical protein
MTKLIHKEAYCKHCKMLIVICTTCGNNTCNGGYGQVNSKDCPDCPSAYEQMFRKLIQA